MELECDLSKINNEEALRKMWQQSEDVNRKKEIRSQLYKLRESRLRDLYQGDIMADNSVAGFGKDPLATSHGDALADLSFQSLKSKEIRDSLSPTEMKFQSMTLNNPNTTGWNVQSSKEVSPDGRGFRAETVATTDGVESVNGGIAEFKGRNEEHSSAHHEGDDKNFVKKAMESSKSHLQEKVVIGDENSERTEVRTSSTKSSSSSQVIQSSSNVEYDDGFPIQQQPYPQKYLMDSSRLNHQDLQQRQQLEQQRLLEEQRIYEQQFQQEQERRTTEQVLRTHQNTQQKNISQNIQTQETHEHNKRYVDMDKASPEYQQHVQYLMQQPGEIISSTVEYPKPNVKMITTVKRLPDGTIVRNKRYETEEAAPTAPTTHPNSNVKNQTQPKQRDAHQPSKSYQPDSSPRSRPSQDMVDNSSPARRIENNRIDDVETKFSSIKKSSNKFSTETTSETVQEFDGHHPQSGPSSHSKPKTSDFSTHGFPSVKPNKPTQEYPNERPHAAYPTQGHPSQSTPVSHTDNNDNITERRINTKDGEVIIVSSEKKSNFKTSTNSERIVETEHVIHDDQSHQKIPNKTPRDFSTHGFPSVKEPSGNQPKNYYPSGNQMRPKDDVDKLPQGMQTINNDHISYDDEGEVVVVSSQKSHTAKHSTNTERIIEHEIISDDQQGTFPRIHPNNGNVSLDNYTVTTPGEQNPQGEFPGYPKKLVNPDYSTQGFPSVRNPSYITADYPEGTSKHPSNDYATQNYPSMKSHTRPAAGLPSSHNQHPNSSRKSPSQDYSTQGFPSVRSPSKGTPTQGYPSKVDNGRPTESVGQPRATPTNKTQSRTPSPNKYKPTTNTVRETTERIIRKEKEVDSAHRAFAASLRSSSPMEHFRRDGSVIDTHSRHTPRSSVSSTRTYRRDMREGSHDSAPSETSRISTTTMTRSTPPRAAGGRTVVTKVVSTKIIPGSSDSLNVTSPRATKSPSPGKTVTTTTTTTRTSKDVPKVTDNQHTRITSNKNDTIFPINEPPPLTSITKIKFSANHKQPHKQTKDHMRKANIPVLTDSIASTSAEVKEVIEAPCLKKHYYKLGPSDLTQAQLNTTTSHPIKNPQIYEKSPTKKPSSQPAPNSRSSTPSYNNRKPSTSVMADDYDDGHLDTTSPYSPQSSRSPQKITPSDRDQSQVVWQMPCEPDNDERRTVNRETTFEKTENSPMQPRKPNFAEPNVEWILVDDVDDQEDDVIYDNDSFAPEVVDATFNVKKANIKLIEKEKQQNPAAPQRKPRPTTTTTTTTVTTKKSQTKPNDKSPLKPKPSDSRSPQQIRTSRPSPESKTPVQSTFKTPAKVLDNKPLPKGPKSSVPSYASPLKKTVRTAQILKERTTKLIEAERPKLKPQGPERKVKPEPPIKRKPNIVQEEETVLVTETSQKHIPDKKIEQPVYEPGKPKHYEQYPLNDRRPYEPHELSSGIMQPQRTFLADEDTEPNYATPGILKPQDTDNKPIHKSPALRKPTSPGFQKLQSTFDERSPQFGKPHKFNDEINLNSTETYNETQFSTTFYKTPEDNDDKPITERRSTEKPEIRGQEPEDIERPEQGVHDYTKPQKFEPNYKTPQQRPQSSEKKPDKQAPEFETNYRTQKQPNAGKPVKPGFKPLNTDDEEGMHETESIVVTSEKSVAKHIKKFETNILKKESPKPQEIKKSPINEKNFPKTAVKDKSPTRTQKKPHMIENIPANTTPRIGKPIREQPSDTEDDKEFEETIEFVINTEQKTVENPIYPGQKPQKVNGEESPTRIQNKPGQKYPDRVVSPTRDHIRPQEFIGKRSQSPNKHNSPERVAYTDKRPKSPNKHVSPQRTQKTFDDKTFTSSLKTTTVVKEVLTKQINDEEEYNEYKPKDRKPITHKPVKPEYQTFTPSSQFKPEKLTKLPARGVSPTKPQTKSENLPEKRAQSPNKHVSPNRTPNKPDQILFSHDESFRKSLRATETVTEKFTENFRPKTEFQLNSEHPSDTEEDDKITETSGLIINTTQKQKIQEFDEPLLRRPQSGTRSPMKAVSPTRKPTDDKFKERPQSPKKHVSPTRTPKKSGDMDTLREDKTFTTTITTKKILKEDINQDVDDKECQLIKTSPKTERYSKSPTRELSGKRPQSPHRHLSPTRKHSQPFEDHEQLSTSLIIAKTLTEKTEKNIDDKKYSDKKTPNEKDEKPKHKSMGPKNYYDEPSKDEQVENSKGTYEHDTSSKTSQTTEKLIQEPESPTEKFSPASDQKESAHKPETKPTSHKPYPDKPFDNKQDEIFTDTSEYIISTKTTNVVKNLTQEPESPLEEFSPTTEQKIPEHELPEKSGKRPQSPTKTERKPTNKETTEKVDHGRKKSTPYENADKPERTSEGRKPYSGRPFDDEQDEVFRGTTEYVISSNTCKVTEKLSKEPQSSTKGHSPTRVPKSPEKKVPEEPDVTHKTDKRPKSPTKTAKKPEYEDEVFKSTLNTSRTVTEKTIRNTDNDYDYQKKVTSYKKGGKPETTPTGRKPYSDKPFDGAQGPQSPIKEFSPTRKQKKPDEEKPTNEDQMFTTTMNVDRGHEVKPKPHKKGDKPETEPTSRKPYSDRPSDNEEDEILVEISEYLISSETKKSPLDSEEPKLPIRGVSPTRTQKEPDHKMPEYKKGFTSKTTEFVAEKTTKDTILQVEKPNELQPKSVKPRETHVDETYAETTEFVLKSTNEPKYPESHKPDKKSQKRPGFQETDDNQTFVHSSEFTRNTSQKFISTEQQAVEIEHDGKASLPLRNRKQSPTRSPSPKSSERKPIPVNDQIFRKSLRNKSKDQKPTDEDTHTDDMLIETCERSYIIDKSFDAETDQEKLFSTTLVKSTEKKPYNYVEVTETIEGQTYPEDAEQFPVTRENPKNRQPAEFSQEPWLSKQVPKFTINVNEKFIDTERIRKETPDGAFISKTTEPSTPTSPTFKKKGTGRSDTFEERCRQILGMETYGDTPGNYKKQPSTEIEEEKTCVTKTMKTMEENDLKGTAVFQIKIEDCDEDEEPFCINRVKKTLNKQINTNEPSKDKPKNALDKPEKESAETEKVFETENEYKREAATAVNQNMIDIETDFLEQENIEEKYIKGSKKSEVKITKKSSSRSNSPTKSVSPTRGISAPTKESPKRKPSKDSLATKSNKNTPQKPDDETTSIKDRLRSSTRKTKSPAKTDQVDGSESSPEHSPTRYTERRRSSNISVTTEIIIEHTDSDTPNKKEKSPATVGKKPKDSIFKEIIDSTVLPEKLTRRLPVTERKESAPVHRVTNKDKDSKMSRSTSENLIKIKSSEPHTPSAKTPNKTTDHRRPNKCFATKSINLSATDRLINSGDMENVIIDIQHAKSSREPSPDKIVPTPVPAHLDTGKPRYPDVVQEPEDYQPKRTPQVKNIPIFEEENNSYIGCHITEINIDRKNKTTYDSLSYEEEILKNPVVEAPPSLDYITSDKPSDDESLLTVHEKVNKFQNITEEVSKSMSVKNPVEKAERVTEDVNDEHIYSTVKLAPTAPQKSPEMVRTISKHISKQNEIDFNNEANENYPITSRSNDYVECLATNKKLTKEFKVSHHETVTEVTEKTSEKYQQPQEYHDHDDYELIPHTATHTSIIEERRQKNILNRPSVFDSRNKKPTPATTTTTKTPLKCNKSPVKDSEKLRPDIKSRTKPTSAVTNTPTEQTLKTKTTETDTTMNATFNKANKQSPQRKNSDIDYEVRGSNVETGVRSIISKQTKLYSNNTTSNDSKTNDLKKPTATTTTSNKKPEKHMPVRLAPPQNSDENDFYADAEIIVTLEETQDTDIESQVVNADLNKEANTEIPSTNTSHKIKKQPTAHSSTNSSPTDQPLKTKTKEHLVKLTEKSPLKSNTVTSTTTTSFKTYETIERADDIDENLLEPSTKKSSSPNHTKTNKMLTTASDSVAARRSLFENNNDSPSNKRVPSSGRRPSYMDHTKSSLEHTRRDSLEINKTNYSRKPSQPEEEVTSFARNSMVKFEVPHGKRVPTARAASITEDINVEEIFDLDVLEKLLETVQSYEIRRRIRAQIRLIKKNQKNDMISSTNTEVTTQTLKTCKAVSSEELDTVTTSSKKSKPVDKTTPAKEPVSTTKKEYIFEETYPTIRRSPRPNRYPYEEEKEEAQKPTRSESPQSPVGKRNTEHARYHSPEHQQPIELVEEHVSRTTKQQYRYKDEHEHEEVYELRHETSPTRKSPSPSRKQHSANSSPERRHASPESHGPLRSNERSHSPQTKSPQSSRITSSRSPDRKSSTASLRKSSTGYEQQEIVKSSTSKSQTKLVTTTKPEDKTPIWADRKNILKAPTSTTPKKPSTSTSESRSGYLKTSKSTTTQKMTSNKSSFMEDDCITSSYGIGPTDENGLPLFGIRALKKKKPIVEPSETTEEVTGYVVEEKYYSDNKTKPTVERKEFIYSTNPVELQKLQEQAEVTSSRRALKDVELKESRQAALISKATPALRSSPEDDFLDSTTKYVRRGSVKEISEKFIQREASSTVTEKSNNYPKAGLILRTNSRKNSRDVDTENENFESYKTTKVQQHLTSTVLDDSDDNQHEYEVEEVSSRHSGRFITESESECDSIETQREFKKVTSSTSSSMATRSFLNSQGEDKVVTNVSDCLERMRNADNVVEEGDTADDQEARALLNKFLGASIIMKGVESSIPATNRQSKIITKTTTSCNLSDDNDGDNNAKHEIKTTRITKTIKSGSSSAPVTYTTCDIEEIWDEEILKELLEQARTYEERRKIRSRLRELMADREEKKKESPKGDNKEAAVAAHVTAEEESSASEYEEIVEEVTDYSETESDVDDNNPKDKLVICEKSLDKEEISETLVSVAIKSESSAKPTANSGQVDEIKTVIKSEAVEEIVEECDDQTDSSEKGESSKPRVHDKLHQIKLQTTLQENIAHNNQSTNSQKLKSAQTQSTNNNNNNNKSKTGVTESNNMLASYNNSNYKALKGTSATVQTAGRADSNSLSNKHNKNNNSTSRQGFNSNNSESSSGSLGGKSVVVGSSSDKPRQVDRLGVPQKEDSGTESGEDLRLIAAGLRDQLQIQSDSNIIEDVTCALSRLENSLKEGKDISVDVEKRKALLALVARLRAGLTSPEKLAEIAAAMSELDGNEGLYGETSSPEADGHRSNRSRFGKRKNRVNRHTVGVSREELADARRYMEDMLLISNISQSTTPEANSALDNTPPQWFPQEKNASTGSVLTENSTPVLQRPKQFVPEENTNMTYTARLKVNSNGKRRPLSGEYSVSFEKPEPEEANKSSQVGTQGSPEDGSKVPRFTSKKHLMKRANTIDLAKAHKYNHEFDTDSDAEDKGSNSGLKRAVQVSVKKRVQNVVPPFEPKTENDRKFLAFINKQSDKPGLSWTTSRSVSNWTNKFGSIKSTFEGGLAGKPPQPPHHVSANTRFQQTSKLFSQPASNNVSSFQAPSYITNQQIAQKLQREAERQSEERRRMLEKEHLEYERREREKLERQRQLRERQERERLEREHFERQRREQDQMTAAKHAAILREQEQLAVAKQVAANMNVPQPIPINEFKHAPQSVFRPIESGEIPQKPIYKPIPQHPTNSTNWQSINAAAAMRGQANTLIPTTPGQYGNTRPDHSFITSPPISSRSPIALPWASKPTVDSSGFKSKAHRFEERSKYDNINNRTPIIQRHNSLRSSNGPVNPISDDFRKRPSLPNAFEDYSGREQIPPSHDPLPYLPPPQNISFTYSSLKPKSTYQSYPCLPSAIVNNPRDIDYQRLREDSLTDPHSVPLVLTSTNPSYCPPSQHQPQLLPLSQHRSRKQFDLVSPVDSAPTSPSIYTMPPTDCTDDDLDSDNLLEYQAVSRVMGKPQGQTAVTVTRRTGHMSDDELYGKNSRAAKNLLHTIRNLGNSNSIGKTKNTVTKRPEADTSPRKNCLSPDGRSYQAPIVEPLFPELNKFQANRKPLYMEESNKQTSPSIYSQPAPRRQVGMYKSMENLSRSTAKSQINYKQQPPPPKPYVSETQTSYVVTYPTDDTTDDDDFSRSSQKKMIPPNSLDLKRNRKTSENSTGSSTTTTMSFNQNLPSPNTCWTSNPIVIDATSKYQNLPASTIEPSYYAANSPAITTYASVNQNQNYKPASSLDYIKMAREYETPAQRPLPSISTQQHSPLKPTYNQTTARDVPKSSYETNAQRQLQQNKTNQKKTPQQPPERHQKPLVTQKSADYPKQNVTTSIKHEKESFSNVQKTENHQSINPKNSNISQEMLVRLDQQRERISNETRRKSLGSNLDSQMEDRNSPEYKSSAPSDTPDIVKSSLPKDESQPILKKFGPPQRHHYMPNSYQSPSTNSSNTAAVITSTRSSNIQGKNLLTSAKQTSIKTSQQFLSNTRPIIMETPATPQPDDDYIPRNIVYNNVHAFSSMSRRQEDESISMNLQQHQAVRPNKLSKSDSWNQIMMLQSQHVPTNTTKFNQSPTNELRRTKSGHTLALPKMFEAAITKTDINEKQKTVAAYFSGQKSPTQPENVVEQIQQATKRSVINRTKTSEKVSAASRKSLGSSLPIAPPALQRSATMPHIANLNLLDESNVEDAFEQLIMDEKQQKSSSSTTEKTETKEKDGAVVTTTTKVTTRTVTGSAATKPVSPFAKFKQLDGQNSQQSAKSPTTPTTTTSGGGSTASPTSGNQPIFRFTDPALNAKAATVKEQLLQWCQSKTQEYENIEITNFSTSWNNGLAFCALIHHFLPDAFDYSQLTPKNRRKNFELAFTVADEKAGIAPLLDVEDMVVMQRPDWKCVFVYVQSIYRRFRNCQ